MGNTKHIKGIDALKHLLNTDALSKDQLWWISNAITRHLSETISSYCHDIMRAPYAEKGPLVKELAAYGELYDKLYNGINI